jgi:hypothetical protein
MWKILQNTVALISNSQSCRLRSLLHFWKVLLNEERSVVNRDIVLAGHTIGSRCRIVVQLFKQVIDLFRLSHPDCETILILE